MSASPSHQTALHSLKNWLRNVNRRRLDRRKQSRKLLTALSVETPHEASTGVHRVSSIGIKRIASARSATDQAAENKVRLGKSRRLTPQDLLSVIVASKCDNGFVVSVSHDDYGVSHGGVQNILGDECREFNRRGVSYLHLCPVQPIRSLAPQTQPAGFHFALRFNGEALGWLDGDALQEVLRLLVQRGTMPYWVLHHLMGHSPEVLEQLVAVGCAQSPLFWTHDFFAACTSYTLLRNDVTFCHAPPLDSPACRICTYGRERGAHTARVKRLLLKLQPTIVAPSQNALEVWTRVTRFSPEQSVVLQPAKLLLEQQARPPHYRPLRIAYLGNQAYHKGWEMFRILVETLQGDDRFQFYHFGEAPTGLPSNSLCHVPVKVSETERDAMIRTVAQNEIDVVVCWSLWPETFNFTVHEAIAGGAFVVVRSGQGNVWPAAQTYAPQASRMVEDESELENYLRSGQILSDVNASPRYRGQALLSKGSAELIILQKQEMAAT